MLNPTLLLAAAIDADGRIALPVAGSERAEAGAEAGATALFWPGEDGAILQRVAPAGAEGPLDVAFFARCLRERLGPLTPALFAEPAPGEPAPDAARVATIRDAFAVHLLAYEDRLI